MSDKKEDTQSLPAKVEIVERFLRQQEKEIDARREELELQKQENEYSFEYANKALEAQEKHNANHRQFIIRIIHAFLIAFGIIIICILFFMGYALYLNKDDVVQEIIRFVFYATGGGAGGYAIGRYRKKSTKTNSESEE